MNEANYLEYLQALGGVDLLVRLCAMSVSDEVIAKACRALIMLMMMEGGDEESNSHSYPVMHQPSLSRLSALPLATLTLPAISCTLSSIPPVQLSQRSFPPITSSSAHSSPRL